jgi:hypothetical protein
MRVPTLLIFFFIFSSFWDDKHVASVDIEATFVNWNKATIASLRLQSTGDEQTRAKDYYKNRLAAFYAYIDIKTYSQINKESIRYKFLELVANQLETDNVFIIEANNSGEHVDIRSVVVYPKVTNNVDVEIYRYNLQGWRKDTVIKNYALSISNTFLNEKVKWAKGFNQDDVTISHFQKGKVRASEFFLFGTLANENVKKLVSIR